jgi:hypothetical protein
MESRPLQELVAAEERHRIDPAALQEQCRIPRKMTGETDRPGRVEDLDHPVCGDDIGRRAAQVKEQLAQRRRVDRGICIERQHHGGAGVGKARVAGDRRSTVRCPGDELHREPVHLAEQPFRCRA